jgi:hypothetical protein
VVVVAFIAFVILAANLFRAQLSRQPYDLFGLTSTSKK